MYEEFIHIATRPKLAEKVFLVKGGNEHAEIVFEPALPNLELIYTSFKQ